MHVEAPDDSSVIVFLSLMDDGKVRVMVAGLADRVPLPRRSIAIALRSMAALQDDMAFAAEAEELLGE